MWNPLIAIEFGRVRTEQRIEERNENNGAIIMEQKQNTLTIRYQITWTPYWNDIVLATKCHFYRLIGIRQELNYF